MEVSRPSLLHDAHNNGYTHSLRASHAAFMDAGAKSFYYDDDDDMDDDEVRDLRMSQFPRPSRLGNVNEVRMSSIAKLPTMPLRGPAFHGWLWKKGASFKTWKKRFFLLNGSTLTYYTQSCVVSTELGIKCLEMPAKGGLRVASADFTDMTQFGIKITSSSGRVLYVQAGDRGARIKWLGVLQEASKKRHSDSGFRSTTVSDVASFKSLMSSKHSVDERSEESLSLQSSSMSSTLSSEEDANMVGTDMKGWLYVRRRGSAFVTLFKKRYVTLADGHLTLTRTQRDRRPHEKTHEVISATVWSEHDNGLRVQLGNHKELVMYADSSDGRKRWLQALHNNL